MAIGTYDLWLDHWNGTRLVYLDSMDRLEYTRTLHNVGVLNLTMPSTFDVGLLQDDYKVEIWRGLPGIPKRLENVFLSRGSVKSTDEKGTDQALIVGVDGNDILKRRFVWAQPGSAQARKTGYAGNILKEYVSEAIAQSVCYGATSSSKRADIADYLTVQADNDDGESFTKNYEYKTLFDVANGICNTSTGRETPMWWLVYPVSRYEYQLRCYETLMGQDLTGQVTISPVYGMAEARHEYDASEEFNMVVGAGGKIGLGSYPDYRKMEYAYNQARVYDNPFSWRERFLDVGDEPDYLQIIDECYDEVSDEENVPSEVFSCKLEEMESFRYGRDWDLGDKVRLSYRGLQLDAVIKTVYIKVEKTEEVWVQFKIEPEMDVQTS